AGPAQPGVVGGRRQPPGAGAERGPGARARGAPGGALRAVRRRAQGEGDDAQGLRGCGSTPTPAGGERDGFPERHPAGRADAALRALHQLRDQGPERQRLQRPCRPTGTAGWSAPWTRPTSATWSRPAPGWGPGPPPPGPPAAGDGGGLARAVRAVRRRLLRGAGRRRHGHGGDGRRADGRARADHDAPPSAGGAAARCSWPLPLSPGGA
ncbi:unnamed protein product, partial [Heterosigma akashiwo]